MLQPVSRLPSVDSVPRAAETKVLLSRFGRIAVTATLRHILSGLRAARTFAAPPAIAAPPAMSTVAHDAGLTLIEDRGSGSPVDLARRGLRLNRLFAKPRPPVPMSLLSQGINCWVALRQGD